MPLTAYSVSQKKEIDLEQALSTWPTRSTKNELGEKQDIPEELRVFLREDLECPCCFVTGAEVVRESVSRTSKRAIRQGYFRFSSPGHKPECDYAGNDSTGFIPDNLVAFGSAKTNLTRVVRDLVCKGIQYGIFSQKSIRDMRQWFFQRRVSSLFRVEVDPKLPAWLYELQCIAAVGYPTFPSDAILSSAIVSIPGFDWKRAARCILVERHKGFLETIQRDRLCIHQLSDRVEYLAKKFQNKDALDPSSLQEEYTLSISLANFASRNFEPLTSANKKNSFDVAESVLALSALLLFVSDWNLSSATELFAILATINEPADLMLGNIHGLNPFHDFKAWETLKKLQESNMTLPCDLSPRDELSQIEADLRLRFQAPLI